MQRPQLESRCARVDFTDTRQRHLGSMLVPAKNAYTMSVYVDAAIWVGCPPDGVLMMYKYMCNIALW